MKNVNITYTITREGIFPPIFKRYGDAGFDLRCGKHFYLKPGGNRVPCGTRFAIPYGHEGQIRPRSGNSCEGIPAVTVEYFFKKCGVNFTQWSSQPNRCNGGSIYDAIEQFIDTHGDVKFSEKELIRLDACKAKVELGTVDAGYRGEVTTTITNCTSGLYVIPQNARVSQMVINELPTVIFEEGEVKEDTERASGGYSSTGLM